LKLSIYMWPVKLRLMVTLLVSATNGTAKDTHVSVRLWLVSPLPEAPATVTCSVAGFLTALHFLRAVKVRM
jgi:hypothetical protein